MTDEEYDKDVGERRRIADEFVKNNGDLLKKMQDPAYLRSVRLFHKKPPTPQEVDWMVDGFEPERQARLRRRIELAAAAGWGSMGWWTYDKPAEDDDLFGTSPEGELAMVPLEFGDADGTSSGGTDCPEATSPQPTPNG